MLVTSSHQHSKPEQLSSCSVAWQSPGWGGATPPLSVAWHLIQCPSSILAPGGLGACWEARSGLAGWGVMSGDMAGGVRSGAGAVPASVGGGGPSVWGVQLAPLPDRHWGFDPGSLGEAEQPTNRARQKSPAGRRKRKFRMLASLVKTITSTHSAVGSAGIPKIFGTIADPTGWANLYFANAWL